VTQVPDEPVKPPAPADTATPATEPPRPTLSEIVSTVNGQLDDVYFGYDQFDPSPEAVAVLRRDAELLKTVLHDFPGLRVAVQGHCDERGSAEYNLGLGDRRATAAADLLRQLGLPSSAVVPISYGKEAPQCSESTESCWRLNRRAHLVVRTPPTE
jgi:peptidoglycan-associated lipoprotein